MQPALDREMRDRIRLLIGSFSADPTDPRVFAQLEEHLFLSGSWNELAEVYECRIAALDVSSAERGELLLRMAEILDERLQAPRAAMRRYKELLSRNPSHLEALARLRRVHARLGESAAALQIAELEEALDLPDPIRARTLAEAGDLWRELGELDEARQRFDEALRLAPGCDPALAGLAVLALDEGDRERALALHQVRIDTLAGAARLDAMEQLAAVVETSDPERARGLLAAVVAEDPERNDALEKLGTLEAARGANERADVIRAQLWRLVDEPGDRAQLALEAATARLDGDGDAAAALTWIERAREDAPEDSRVHRLRVRALRRAGRSDELIDALEDLDRAEEPSAMRELEIAVLHEREGRPKRAVEFLARLVARDPDDGEALAVLDRCLARLGRHPDRVDVLARRIELAESEDERADLCIDLGDALRHHLGDDAAALERYRAALSHAPEHASAAERLKQLLLKLERHDELDSLLVEAALRSDDAEAGARAWCELGALRLERADREGAREAYEHAVARFPDGALAVEALARLDRGEPTLEPSRRGALLRSRLESARLSGDLERARLAAEELAALEPCPDSFRALAELARDTGARDAELRALGALLPLEPDAPSQAACLARLAELELEGGDGGPPERAVRHLRRALELGPSPQLHSRLVDLCRRAGDLDSLVTELRARLASEPDDAATRLELARTLTELGDRSGAIEALRPAFDAAPGRADLADLMESLLADEDRIEELCEALGTRLDREREPARRRELAYRQAGLLLEGLDRPRDAAAALRELADPSRRAPLEDLYERALEASADGPELEVWLGSREGLVDGADRAALALRRAVLQQQAGRLEAAIATLERARESATGDSAESVVRALLPLLREAGDLGGEADALGQLASISGDPAARTQLRLERARLLLEPGGDADAARHELHQLESEPALESEQLERLADLLGRAGSPAEQLRALERAVGCEGPEDARARALRSIAAVCAGGPEPVRDAARAESALRDLLAHVPGDGPSAVRLAELLLERGEPREAAGLLAQARAHGDPAGLDELLHRALEVGDDVDRRIELCAERARDSSAPDRPTWLARWLEGLEAANAPAAELLPVVELQVEADPDDAELEARLLALLRGLGDHDALARRLERSLESDRLAPHQHSARGVELLRLYEGPLDAPDRALDWIERLAGDDRELRLRGAELAARAGERDRELALLEPLVGSGAAEPEAERRHALALAALGRDAEAEPRLRHVRARRPHDPDVLEALEAALRRRSATTELAELLETHFAIEPAEGRARLAREGLRLAEADGDATGALRWIRRWQAVEGLPTSQLERWVELERGHGERRGRLVALAALRTQQDHPEARARVCAEEAELHVGAGALELARQRYDQALELSADPPDEWLAALSEVLERQGRTAELAALLGRRLAAGRVSEQERLRLREVRADLLVASPDSRAEGTRELRAIVDEDRDAEPDTQVRRLRRLLELDDQPERATAWCDTAERLAPLLPADESIDLARELGRRLAFVVCDRARAVHWWEDVLEREPEDAEALGALTSLFDQPGGEARRAELLEQLAASAGRDDPAPWVEAAGLRWDSLRDASSALDDLDRADETAALDGALRERALELRCGVYRHLDRTDDERSTLEALIDLAGDRPDSARHWLRLATLECRGEDGKAAAERAVWCALERAQDDPGVRAEAREVLASVGSWESAAELLRVDVGSAGPDQRALLLRELARLEWDELGRAEEACAALEELAQLAELDPDDLLRWARALESGDQWPEAVLRRRQALLALGERASPEDWLELARSAIERTADADRGREACEAALAASDDPAIRAQALELRARLVELAGDPATAIDDLVAVADAHLDRVAAAAALVQAGDLARHQLGDEARAWALYRRALKRDATCVRALQGAGGVALERREWSEAERMFGLAIPLLESEDARSEAGEAALCAARAALEQRRDAEAFRYLEQSLEIRRESPEALDAMATLALRLGDWTRARQCLEGRLEIDDLDPNEQAERWVRLAQAHEGLDGQADAVDALERAVELRPTDEVSRARHVDLLGQVGELERAVAALESWIERAPDESRAGLELRAARLELELERRADARARLDRLVAEWPQYVDAWLELLALAVDDGGPDSVLEISFQIPLDAATAEQRGTVRWLEARALVVLGRDDDAARRALETLEDDPSNVDAARLLAANLGRISDWQRAVSHLETALDCGDLPATVEAELWEAVGRAYAGPLESIEQAERCYRRALDANPLRAGAREALADVTVFDPAAHAESVHLHRELLEGFPARPRSWRAIAHIAQHWQREPAAATCAQVLASLGQVDESATRTDRAPLVQTGDSGDPVVRAATELLRALEEAGGLPATGAGLSVPAVLRPELQGIAGAAWDLDDAGLQSLWSRPSEDGILSGDRVSRRTRRRLNRALRGFSRTQLRELDAAAWRSEMLAQAASRALTARRVPLVELLHLLLELWPATSQLDLRSGGNLAEAIQLCPPAQQLLLRIADPTLSALGL